ncbi:hypothetical protein FIU95_21485 (plasmid) [Microbulbifer sp. THAF38]|nr:hypothetical protein FIU95_21485 [Microbulbifer sp. THAF38]
MKNTKDIVMLGCLMISGPCFAGPQDQHKPELGISIRKTDIEFVQEYHDHLDRGIFRHHLESYWTEDRGV